MLPASGVSAFRPLTTAPFIVHGYTAGSGCRNRMAALFGTPGMRPVAWQQARHSLPRIPLVRDCTAPDTPRHGVADRPVAGWRRPGSLSSLREPLHLRRTETALPAAQGPTAPSVPLPTPQRMPVRSVPRHHGATMRHAKIMLTALTLLVTALTTPGCAGTRAGQMADQTPLRSTKKNQEDSMLGRLDDPAFLFGSRLPSKTKALRVKAMAYTGCSPTKSKRATRGAWGDRLTPDVKAVAVSPDLLEMGLDRGDVIHIEGLPGDYKVLDVMHARHDRTIDIFYGDDQCGARDWGRRSLTITWQ